MLQWTGKTSPRRPGGLIALFLGPRICDFVFPKMRLLTRVWVIDLCGKRTCPEISLQPHTDLRPIEKFLRLQISTRQLTDEAVSEYIHVFNLSPR
jgi:hypothetical protein